jgi:hypothetical protein
VTAEPKEADERRSPEELARIRDEALTRLMAMPPRRHKDMRLGKPRRAKLAEASPLGLREEPPSESGPR